MPPHITDEFYEQGRALYQAGGTLRSLHETMIALEDQERAAEALAMDVDADSRIAYLEKERRRFCSATSLTMGFADGFLADLRRVVAGRGGQRA